MVIDGHFTMPDTIECLRKSIIFLSQPPPLWKTLLVEIKVESVKIPFNLEITEGVGLPHRPIPQWTPDTKARCCAYYVNKRRAVDKDIGPAELEIMTKACQISAILNDHGMVEDEDIEFTMWLFDHLFPSRPTDDSLAILLSPTTSHSTSFGCI